MHTQIKTPEGMVGKTIAGLFTKTTENDTMLFVFTDKTMALLSPISANDSIYLSLNEEKIDLLEFPREEIIASGAATVEELDQLYAEQEQIKNITQKHGSAANTNG